MFEMGAETMRLPLEEKMKYEQGDSGLSFGYSAYHLRELTIADILMFITDTKPPEPAPSMKQEDSTLWNLST